jgi:hypothetical protein
VLCVDREGSLSLSTPPLPHLCFAFWVRPKRHKVKTARENRNTKNNNFGKRKFSNFLFFFQLFIHPRQIGFMLIISTGLFSSIFNLHRVTDVMKITTAAAVKEVKEKPIGFSAFGLLILTFDLRKVNTKQI